MTAKTEIERLKELYLLDVDDEDREDNLKTITEWESALRTNRDFATWQEMDTTKSIEAKARGLYIESSLTLANNKTLSEADRHSLHAKRDAALWLISIIAEDMVTSIENINLMVRTALTRAVT